MQIAELRGPDRAGDRVSARNPNNATSCRSSTPDRLALRTLGRSSAIRGMPVW